METASKHYKFINSNTGYVIYYYSITGDLPKEKIIEQLEKIQAKVAVENGIYFNTVYWEEIHDE